VLSYSAIATIPVTDHLLALTLQRSDGDRPGPIVALVLPRGRTTGTASLALRGRDREDLVAGRLYLHLYSEQKPLGAARVALRLP